MAWTAPKTWASAEVIVASGSGSLNEQIRDNLLALSGHTHSGSAGDGSSTLGIITTSQASFTFTDQEASPSVAGRLQRNSSALEYYNGTAVVSLSSNAVASTASLRTLVSSIPSTAVAAASGDHTHS